MRDNGLASLWLRNVPTNSNTQVQPPANVYYNGLRFSPDGNYFYFVRSDPGNPDLKFLYRSPLLGGTPQKLASDVDSNITFSPDGQKFAFMRFDNPEPGKYQLIVRSAESSDEAVLTGGPAGQALYNPAWSPDGKFILCNQLQGGNGLLSLVAVDARSGRRTTIYSSNDRIFEGPRWLPDQSGVLGLVREQSSNYTRTQVGFLSYPDGRFSPVTRDTNSYSGLSVAASGHVFAAVLDEGRWNMFLMPASGSSADARQVTSAGQVISAEAYTYFTWTRDNQWIDDHGLKLNVINPTTGTRTVIATQEGRPAGTPSACPDGRYIVFLSFQLSTGSQSVWRMDTAGGNLKPLTSGKLDQFPTCSSDGMWIYYLIQGDERKLARVPIDGGVPQAVSDLSVSGIFDLSPDGKLAAFGSLEHSGEHKEKLAIVDVNSGKTVKLVDFERFPFGPRRFAHDGNAIVYPTRDHGVDNLWLQPLDGSKGRLITDFASEHIYDFHWSFDGKQLAMVRGHTDSDVVLIHDSRQ
jgi:Tol biopolymer transport system component